MKKKREREHANHVSMTPFLRVVVVVVATAHNVSPCCCWLIPTTTSLFRACVIFLGTNKEKGCALQDCINKQAGSTRAVFHMCDVTDWSLQEALYDVAAKQFGKTVDIVIIVAGILESSDLLNDAEQDGRSYQQGCY